MHLHLLLLVARLQRVKHGAGLQDDRKLPPPQNVALHLTTERCSKNGGDADECVAALQADNAKFLCGGVSRGRNARLSCCRAPHYCRARQYQQDCR